jgi:hypothetical protein
MSVSTFGFRDITESTGTPSTAINQNTRINYILAKGVLDRDLTSPPGSPSDADAYIVAATATGAWVGHEDDIAYWFDESGVWKFIVPDEGLIIPLLDEDVQIKFSGSGGWDIVAGGGTVTSVDITGTLYGLSFTGGPITGSGSFTFTGTLAVPVANITPSTATPIGVGSIELGHATDCTIARSGAGDITIEANIVYRAGGTDVPVTDGGTGRSTGTTAYSLIATGTTATGAQQTLANGATTEILVGGGASALPVWTTANGSGAPVRTTSPALVTPALGTPSSGTLDNCTKSVTTECIAGYIGTVADKTYKIVVKIPHGATITEATTISESGTCTATFKINTTALGGTANSVSSSETSQAHASANVASAGDDIQLTVSSNSACLGLSFSLKYTRTI